MLFPKLRKKLVDKFRETCYYYLTMKNKRLYTFLLVIVNIIDWLAILLAGGKMTDPASWFVAIVLTVGWASLFNWMDWEMFRVRVMDFLAKLFPYEEFYDLPGKKSYFVSKKNGWVNEKHPEIFCVKPTYQNYKEKFLDIV